MTSLPSLRPTKILGPNGRPAAFSRLYLTPRNSGNYRGYKPRPSLSPDTRSNVSAYDRAELVDLSRQVATQMDMVGTAIEQKNNWAFGDAWEPNYRQVRPSDKATEKWVAEVTEWLVYQFYPFCNTAGPQFNLRQSMKLMGKAWDVDGDDLLVLTETENHFPQFSLFPATRVGGEREKTLLDGGQFDGAELIDGVIRLRGKTIGYQINNADGKPTQLSTYNADLAFEAQWCDQPRGIPRIGKSILPCLSLIDTDDRLMGALKRACGISFKVKNAEGEAGIANEVIEEIDSPTAESSASIVGGSDGRKVHFEEVPSAGGELYYLDSTQGEDIEEVKFSNPHPNVEAFIERIQRGVLNSLGWFYELLKLTEGGRAPSRTLCELVNMSIWDRQATGYRRWKRVITYALAKAAKHGLIPKPPQIIDYMLWDPGLPKQMSVDAGNDNKIAIDRIKFQLSTVGIEAAKSGYHADYILREQEKELRRNIEMADRLFPLVQSKGISFEAVMQMIRQTSPNPPMNQQPQQQASEE